MKIVIPEKSLSLRELEKRYVLKVLKENGGNKKKASEILGIDRATLYRILEKEGVVEFRNTCKFGVEFYNITYPAKLFSIKFYSIISES
jgi:hypothetical protein